MAFLKYILIYWMSVSTVLESQNSVMPEASTIPLNKLDQIIKGYCTCKL